MCMVVKVLYIYILFCQEFLKNIYLIKLQTILGYFMNYYYYFSANNFEFTLYARVPISLLLSIIVVTHQCFAVHQNVKFDCQFFTWAF